MGAVAFNCAEYKQAVEPDARAASISFSPIALKEIGALRAAKSKRTDEQLSGRRVWHEWSRRQQNLVNSVCFVSDARLNFNYHSTQLVDLDSRFNVEGKSVNCSLPRKDQVRDGFR